MKKGTAIVIGIFAALLIAFFATRERQVSVGVRKLELPIVERDRVTAVEITGPKPAILKKEGAAWMVADPKKPDQKHLADEIQVNSMLDAYKEIKVGDFVTENAEKQAELEVDDAKGTGVKLVRDGEAPVQIVLGKSTKNGGVYLRQGNDKSIFAAQGRFQYLVRKDAGAWRKRVIFSLKPEDFSEVTVHPKGEPPYTLKAEGSAWQLKGELPKGFRLDPSALQGLVQQLATLRTQDFNDSPGTDESLGISGDHSWVEAQLKDGKHIAVHLGNEPEAKPNGMKGPVPAKVEGDPQVYLFASYTAANITRKFNDMRDLSLLSFDPQKVTRIAIQTPGKKTVLAKSGDTWKVIEPKKLPTGFEFDPNQVQNQLQMLRATKGSRLIGQSPSPSESGLARPTTTVELNVEGGPTQSLKFGKEVVAGKDKGKEVYVKGSADALTYAVYDGVRSRLDSGVEMFKKAPPPPNMGGAGGMRGLESLPPDIRKKIEAQIRSQQKP
jgi:hypothetical protein